MVLIPLSTLPVTFCGFTVLTDMGKLLGAMLSFFRHREIGVNRNEEQIFKND